MYINKTFKFIGYIFIFLTFAQAKYVGNILKAKGRVEIIKKNSFIGKNYKFYKGKLEVGDLVRTKRKSFADIKFIDNSEVKIYEKTRLWIKDYIKTHTLKLPYGKVIFEIAKQIHGKYKVISSLSLIGVKGTKFTVVSRPDINIISVFSGKVEVNSISYRQKPILVKPNHIAIILPGQAPKIISVKEIVKKIKKKTKVKRVSKQKNLKKSNLNKKKEFVKKETEKVTSSKNTSNIATSTTTTDSTNVKLKETTFSSSQTDLTSKVESISQNSETNVENTQQVENLILENPEVVIQDTVPEEEVLQTTETPNTQTEIINEITNVQNEINNIENNVESEIPYYNSVNIDINIPINLPSTFPGK